MPTSLRSIPTSTADLVLDALASGVLGGSVVALFFLVVDLLDGQPLFTPSLMGSVLFQGEAAEGVNDVRLAAVVYYSIAHVLAFAGLGAVIAFLVYEVELHSRHPMIVLLVVLGIFEVGFFVAAPLVMSGVVERVGLLRLGMANLLAAASISLFFLLEHRAKAWRQIKHTRADFIFDSFYSGALGGSTVGLFFLIVDLVDGQPLFTPSLLGSVLFHGLAAEAVTQVRLDAIVYYSIVHVFAFMGVGAAVAFMVHEAELHSRHPLVVLLVLFAILEVGFFFAASLLAPGVIVQLGVLRVAAANLLAAGSIGLFFVLSHRVKAWQKVVHTRADLVFDSFYSGAIGGSVVGLFFLLADVLDGQPLFTPSLMGSVLFHGLAAEAVTEVRLDAVAHFTVVHMLGFAAVGAAISWLAHEVELHSRHPALVLLVLFVILEAGFFLAASALMPGVIERLGVFRVAAANLLAAVSILLFFVWSHNAEAWERARQTLRLART